MKQTAYIIQHDNIEQLFVLCCRIYDTGIRLLLRGVNKEMIQNISEQFYKHDKFLPHAFDFAPEHQPIWLTWETGNPNDSQWMIQVQEQYEVPNNIVHVLYWAPQFRPTCKAWHYINSQWVEYKTVST